MIDFALYLDQTRSVKPLVHCITNYVTVHDVANAVIATGGSPIMSDDEIDAPQITQICNALVVNIGTLNTATIRGMRGALNEASRANHTLLLDPVGAGASELRTQTALEFMNTYEFDVIKGNISEIKALADDSADTQGVDAHIDDVVTEENIESAAQFVKKFAQSTGSIVIATGAIDLISDGTQTYAVFEGSPWMSQITGAGCMLAGVVAAYLAANPDNKFEAAVAAVALFGRAGSQAEELIKKTGLGNSSYSNYLVDKVSLMTSENIGEDLNVRELV